MDESSESIKQTNRLTKMEISITLFNNIISYADTDIIMRMIETAGNRKEVETKIKTYFKLIKTPGMDMRRNYLKDITVILNICYALGSYYTITKDKLSDVMMNVMEKVESTKSEGQYLRTCNMLMAHKKFLSFLEEALADDGFDEIIINEDEHTYEFIV
jgi:hypothetical protein